MALHLFLEHPVVGNGVGTFYPTVMFFDVYQSEIGDVTDAHGVIQKIGAEQGMLGLITFGLWVWWLFSFFYKCGIPGTVSPETRVTSQFATLLAVSAFAFQLFSTQYYSSVLWVPLALSWSMVAMSIREDAYNHGQSKAINFLNT
jgi:O-antigen ligase